MSEKTTLRNNTKAKFILRIIGFIALALGLILTIVAFVDFFTSMTVGFQPSLFWMFFISFPLLFVGGVCLSFGYMKAVNAYVVGEQAPVMKDAANYILDGTRDEVSETAQAIAKNIHQEGGIICPRCHTKNEPGATFCDNCGAPLTKKCSCGEVNDVDAKYCRRCGKLL